MSKPDMHSSNSPRTSTIAGINVVTPASKSPDEKAHSLRVQKLSGQWKQYMGSAKVAWGKLTQDQLMETEGKFQKLVGLVQEKYAVSRMDADKQVRAFMDKHVS